MKVQKYQDETKMVTLRKFLGVHVEVTEEFLAVCDSNMDVNNSDRIVTVNQ
jgi:hypothetical protein